MILLKIVVFYRDVYYFNKDLFKVIITHNCPAFVKNGKSGRQREKGQVFQVKQSFRITK